MNDMEGRKPGPTSIKVKLEYRMDGFKEINSPHRSESLHDVQLSIQNYVGWGMHEEATDTPLLPRGGACMVGGGMRGGGRAWWGDGVCAW